MRLFQADAIKGLSIALMVYGHVTFIGTYLMVQEDIAEFLGIFRMPIFLIISGFFSKYYRINQFQKIMRMIAVPYVIFFTLYTVALIVAMKIGLSITNEPITSISDYFFKLLFDPNGAFWYIHALIVLKVTYIFLYKIVKDNVYLLFLFAILFAILFDHIQFVALDNSTYFIIGVLIANMTNYKLAIEKKYLILFFPAFIYLFIFFNTEVHSFTFYEVEINLLMFGLLWIVFTNMNMITRLFIYIGKNTLVILLMHSLFLVSFKILNKYIIMFDETGLLQSIVVTILTIVFSILMSKFFDYIKISQYIFGVDRIYKR